jgi:two-component system sensor histidine kinase MprB
MSLRAKLALAFAAIAVLVAGSMGLLGYTATADQLQNETDRALVASGARPAMGGGREGMGRRQDASLLLSGTGQVVQSSGTVTLPVTQADRAAAAAGAPSVTARTQSVDGTPYRIVTIAPGQAQGAMLVARDWSENASVLRQLATILGLLALALALVAAAGGWLLARQITKRLVQLTETAEQVSATGQLDVVVPGSGADEVRRLAGSFNDMLTRLAQSQAAQQRLVQDAGHELRTPLTSLRTNISLLSRFEELPADVRTRVLSDLNGESRELTGLVDEVLSLAGGQAQPDQREPLRLAEIAEAVATRARRRTGREITTSVDNSVVQASRSGLERALWNLVDNAAKFDQSGGAIDIRVTGGRIEVMDRGPGVEPHEAAHLFDRFYRPVASRSLPGSGLGLAIVKDVAQTNGAQAYVRARDGGGAVFGIAFSGPVPTDS